MRRLLLLLFLAFAACSERKEEAKSAAPAVAEAPGPSSATPASDAAPGNVTPIAQPKSQEFPTASSPAEAEREFQERAKQLKEAYEASGAPAAKHVDSSPAPADTPTPPADGERIALRMYEHLLNGRRAATMRVEWKAVERDGERLVEDTTETMSRDNRDMGGQLEAFESESKSVTLRTEGGEMISQETVTTLPGRVDKSWVERTPAGYHVRVLAGESEETFDIATEKPVMVDAEAFLAQKIRSGEAVPGATFEIPLLGGKRVVTSTLKVVGPDEEGPGLKVVETTEGNDTLWWFADDGSVVRLRIGVRVIIRDDTVRHGDLPRRAAQFLITVPANPELPRIFTTREMLVDVIVRTDETTKPPKIPESPFTEVKERADDRVTLLLKSHDDGKATCPLPIDPKGFEEYLKATALMEVDSARARETAKKIVGDAKDAREAARRIADFVFTLRKGSSKIAQPTMLQILDDRMGDCSEHALLFTGLCRAAGIPVRQCSGYVNIGSDWGAHSWCEVWVGRWIGADPTTNEIGTRARYILLSRPDEPVEAGRITAERTTIQTRRAVYVDGTLDFDDEEEEPDPELYSGIRLAELPEGWEADRGLTATVIKGPGFTVHVSLYADHGYRSMENLKRRMRGGKEGAFGGRPAATLTVTNVMSAWVVSLGREILQVAVQIRPGSTPPTEEQLTKVLAPTLEREE